MERQKKCVGDTYSQIRKQLGSLGFPGWLWQIFPATIFATFKGLWRMFGWSVAAITLAIKNVALPQIGWVVYRRHP